MTTNGIPVSPHPSRTSWYSLTSPPASARPESSSFPAIEVEEADINDAFEEGDLGAPPPVKQNTLKRESLGGEQDFKDVLNGDSASETSQVSGARSSDGGLFRGMADVVLNDPVQSPSRNSPNIHQPRPVSRNLRRPDFEDIQISPASPMTPSIVLSRPPSPPAEDDIPSSFVDVSLAQESPSVKQPSPTRSVPKPIFVPPATSMVPNVQIVQGPNTPVPSPRPGSRNSMSSPQPQPSKSSPAPGTVGPSTATDRAKRAKGISTQDVISKTRPSHLPPKSKEEDLKHMKVWEEMMQKSRLADEQRKAKLRERRLAREQAVENSLHQWEREVLPDIKAAAKDPRLRQLWWKGIPTKIRGRVWYTTLGNPLALSKDAYRSCLSRAKRAISSKSFPADTMQSLEEDIRETLPALHLFHPETGPMYQDLKDLLCAWVVARADEGLGYVRGASSVGAMFLINMPSEQAFVAMRNMLERHCMRSFYGGSSTREDVEAYYRQESSKQFLSDVMPKVYFNFKQHGVSPALYLSDWIVAIFLQHLPFEACSRIWDVLILEGDSFLFRTSIAILGVIESRLFFPERKELLEVLHGENKAALEVARRTESSSTVDLGARYEQYGMNDEVLWDRLDQTEWKDSTWGRLIQRELPDI
ncbi:hypothetical protein FRB90_006188 [Tulasnella sp. 427]|nr:hypothetical protein FRB90_006188 [Tulasnella sp. 427]